MTSPILTRTNLYFAAFALALLFALPAQAMPGLWKLDPISTSGLGGQVDRVVYVPKGTKWVGASLHFAVNPAADSFLGVWVDGNRIMRRQFNQSGEADVDIGNLSSGFHNIKFTIDQQKILVGNVSSSDSQLANRCVNETSATFILKDLQLRYFQAADAPTLSDLPDPLFNPQMPGKHPWRAEVIADPTDALSLSVAARLASDWHATAGIRWIESKVIGKTSPDFVVELVHDPNLDVPARLQLIAAHMAPATGPGTGAQSGAKQALVPVPARLRIVFRDQAGAYSAANALLNKAYLSQINTSSTDLQHAVAAPTWGTEKPYKTLSDFGVADFSLGAQHDINLFLRVPSEWHATAPTRGTLDYRVQKGLLKGSALRLWVSKQLAGSSKLDSTRTNRSSNGYLAFHTQAPFSNQRLLPMYLNARMLVTDQCLPGYNGELWVDAKHSRIDIPHRYKTGVGDLQAALIARPDIEIDGQPGSFTAALALASSMQELVGNHPLAFRIHMANHEDANAPVKISVNAAAYRKQASAHADRLGPSLLHSGVFLQQAHNTYQVLGSSTASLLDFADHWSTSRYKIKDNSDKVFMDASGDVNAPERSQVASKLAVTSGNHYKWLIYLGIFVLLLIMVTAWWLSRRRQ